MARPRLTLAPVPAASSAPARSISQCDYADCEQVQSSEFWPYCSQSCAVRGAWQAVAVLERIVDELDMPLQELGRLARILDGCPFDEDAEKLQHVIRDVRRLIGSSQRELARSAVDFTHGATAFTDALGPRIVAAGDDVRQAHPAWMRHPETWSVARDPKWQNDAMAGDFIQHWLSYHIFGATEETVLVVYRSTWLRDTDKMYEPVLALLADGYEVLCREINQDADMIFGRGELTIYALAETGSAQRSATGTNST